MQISKECANNIILGQASRHVIVRTGALVTDRMLKQISRAKPRTLKEDLVPGVPLIFSKKEVLQL